VKDLVSLGSVHHLFTHRALELTVFRAEASSGRVRLDGFDAHRWLGRRALAGLPASTVARKAMVLAEGPQSPEG
jgi:adenine-specific DNA glycosylase